MNRLPQTAVEARARIEEMWQNQAPPRVHEVPMRIPTTSGKAGALRELLQQSQAPSRVIVPTPVRQSIPMVPIASRTRAAQAAATKLSQGPASNTRSQSNCALERALHVARFLDKKSVSAKRLTSRKFPPAIFAAALAVMDIDSGQMLKYQHLTNHQDQDISRTWNTLTTNKIGRLFQRVGGNLRPYQHLPFHPKGINPIEPVL